MSAIDFVRAPRTVARILRAGIKPRTAEHRIHLVSMLANVSPNTVRRITGGKPVRPDAYERAVPYLKAFGIPAPAQSLIALSNDRIEVL
jgi:hypothetical protein